MTSVLCSGGQHRNVFDLGCDNIGFCLQIDLKIITKSWVLVRMEPIMISLKQRILI